MKLLDLEVDMPSDDKLTTPAQIEMLRNMITPSEDSRIDDSVRVKL